MHHCFGLGFPYDLGWFPWTLVKWELKQIFFLDISKMGSKNIFFSLDGDLISGELTWVTKKFPGLKHAKNTVFLDFLPGDGVYKSPEVPGFTSFLRGPAHMSRAM